MTDSSVLILKMRQQILLLSLTLYLAASQKNDTEEEIKIPAPIISTAKRAVASADDEATRQALETDKQKLALLYEKISPLQNEINQLNRQFWVTKAQVKGNKYNLSASRYRQVEQDEVFFDAPQVTLERLLKLEDVMGAEVRELMQYLNKN